jgi:GTP-binding protein LepA
MLTFDLPLAEVIYDLHDKLKSVTHGYGTMDYELIGYFPADLVRLDILVGGKKVDALSIICDRRDGDRRGRAIVKKLRGEIDRHMFEVALQAAIGTKVIARETISAMRKNVTAKCYAVNGKKADVAKFNNYMTLYRQQLGLRTTSIRGTAPKVADVGEAS